MARFIDRMQQRKAEDLKAHALEALRAEGITLQALEAVTSVDFNYWQRVFDLTSDQHPPLCLPLLLKNKGAEMERFAKSLLQAVSAPYEKPDRSKLNGSIADDVISIVEALGKISEAERENDLNKRVRIEQSLIEIRERIRIIYEEVNKPIIISPIAGI